MKIKSAYELALERAKKIKVSDEEIKRIEYKELENKIEGLVNKYLAKDIELEELIIRIETDKDKNEIKKWLIRGLINKLDLNKIKEQEVILEALLKLLDKKEIVKEIKNIFINYNEELSKEFNEVRQKEINNLKEYGIEGNAILPNMELSPEWVSQHKKILSKYNTKLNKIRDIIDT